MNKELKWNKFKQIYMINQLEQIWFISLNS